jgi:hypothetical protein
MADSFPPTIAPQTDNSSHAPEATQQQTPDAADPVPITEQEVGEYREQDRYLPVSRLPPERVAVTPGLTKALSLFLPPTTMTILVAPLQFLVGG